MWPTDAPSIETDYDAAVVDGSMKEMCSLCSYGSGVEMPCRSKNNWFWHVSAKTYSNILYIKMFHIKNRWMGFFSANMWISIIVLLVLSINVLPNNYPSKTFFLSRIQPNFLLNLSLHCNEFVLKKCSIFNNLPIIVQNIMKPIVISPYSLRAFQEYWKHDKKWHGVGVFNMTNKQKKEIAFLHS
jgi:hypothetical protein